MLELITDRTQADVDRWRSLRDKGWQNMTEAERSEWLAEMKGRYDHRDFNRVESAVATVTGTLRELGYLHTELSIKTDWTNRDIPTLTDWERYYGNVATLRGAIAAPYETPAAPTTGDPLDFRRANDIESILLALEGVAGKIENSWCYAGETYMGEA